MALYGVDFYGASRYGPRVYLDFDASPLVADPRGTYGSLHLTWTPPAGDWSRIRLVRNAFGMPVDQNDGAILLDSASGPGEPSATREAAVRTFTDTNLEQGRFQYYAIWLYVPLLDEWTRAAVETGLVLKDYGYSNRLWELTPSVYRTTSTGLLDNDNETLRTFYRVIGAGLDGLRGEYETLREVNNPDKVSGNLLPMMAAQYGQFFEPELGMKQMRALLRNTVHLYRNKGTVPGVEGFISSVSGYGAKIQPLKNLMLDYNDSSAEESIGRWHGALNCTVGRYIPDAVIDAQQLYLEMRRAGIFMLTSSGIGDARADLTGPGGTGDMRLIGIPVSPSTGYAFSAYTRPATDPRAVRLQIHYYDIAGTLLITRDGLATTSVLGAWTRVENVSPSPVGAAYATVSLVVAATGITGEVHYFDALQFEEGGAVTPYEDARLLDIDVLAPRVNEATNPSFEASLDGWTGSAYRNLLTANQSSLETDTTGWTGYTGNTSMARSTVVSLNGAASLAMQAVAAGNINLRTSSSTGGNEAHAVVPGQVYTAVASFRAATTPRNVRVDIVWRDAAGAYIDARVGVNHADSTTGWHQVHTTGQAPANAAYCFLSVYALNCAAGEVHYVDSVALYADPQGNLVLNPDFENGISGWGPINSATTAVVSSEQAQFGRQSLKLTASATGGDTYALTDVPVVPGQTYTVSAWLKDTVHNGGAAGNYALFASDLVGTSPSAQTTVTGTTATFVKHTVSITPTGNKLRVRLYSPNGTIFWDGVQVTATSSAVEYVPPTTHNLQLDSSMETGGVRNNWQLGYGGRTITHGSDGGYVGSRYYRMGPTTNGDVRIASLSTNFTSMFAAGEWTTVSMYVRLVSGSPTYYRLAGPVDAVLVTPVLNRWVRVQTRVFGVPTADSVSLQSDDGYNVVTDVDAIQIERGNVATPYVDGDRGPGYKWNASENLIANSSFETDTAGWEGLNKNLLTANQSSFETDTGGWQVSNNCTIARSLAQTYNGTASLAITSTAGGYMNARTVTTMSPSVVVGQVYTASAFFRAATTPRVVHVDLIWFTAAGAGNGSVRSAVVADNATGWQQVAVTAQAPANTATAVISAAFPDSAAGEVHYVDAVSLMETPNANLVTNPDFENGTAGYGTIGTQSQEQAYTGRSSLKHVTTAAYQGSSLTMSVVAGVTYTASAYVRSTAAATFRLGSDGGAFTDTSVAMGATWTRVTHTFTPTNTTAYVYFQAAEGGVTFYLDAVQVVVGSAPVDYLPPTTHNLVANPSAEIDTSGWATSGWNLNGAVTSFTRSTVRAYVGSASFRVETASTTYAAKGAGVGVPAVPGQVTVSAYVYVEDLAGATGVQLVTTALDASGARVPGGHVDGNPSYPASLTTAVGSWVRLFLTVTLPPGTVQVGVQVRNYGGSTNASVFHIDGAQLEQGSVATPFVDGSLGAGYGWDSSGNLLTNPSFDTDVASWTADGATMTRDIGAGASGTGSAALTATGKELALHQQRDVAPSTPYTASAFFKSSAPRPARVTLEYGDAWGYGGSGTAKNVASAPIIDLDQLNAPQVLWLPGTAGNYVSTPDVNEIDYDSSTFENGIGKWEGLNKNLLTANQSSAETDLTGFVTGGGFTMARSTDFSVSGTNSVKVTSSGTTGLYPIYTSPGTGSSTPVVPGQVYTAVGHVRGTAKRMQMQLYFTDATGTDVGSAGLGQHVSPNPSGWTQAVAVGQAPPTAVKAYVFWRTTDTPALNDAWYFDAFGIFETPNGNLIPNPDLEGRLTGWSANNTTQAASTEQAYTGRESIKLVQATTGLDAYSASAILPATAGVTYTVSAWVNVTSFVGAAALSRGLAIYDYGNTATFTSDNITAATAGWVRKQVTITPTTSSGLVIRLYSPNGTVYWDAVQLVVGSSAVDYLPPTTHNQAVNPSVEVDTTSYYNNHGSTTLSRVTDRAYVGTASIKSVPATSTNACAVGRSGPAAQGGEVWTGSAYFYCEVATTGKLNVQEWSNGTYKVGSVTSLSIPANTWTRVSHTRKLTDGTTTEVRIVMEGGAGHTLWFDAVQIERGAVATPYADGSFGAGYAWDASESLLDATVASFEADTDADGLSDGWASYVGGGAGAPSYSRASGNALAPFSGTAIQKAAAAQVSGGYYGFSHSGITLVPNTTYTLSAYIAGTAGNLDLLIQAASASSPGGIMSFNQTQSGSSNTTWKRFVLTFTTPADVTGTATLYIRHLGTSTTGSDLYADAVQLEQRSYATPYAQTGTAHASTSTRRQPWVLGGTSIESVSRYMRGTEPVLLAYDTRYPRLPGGSGITLPVTASSTYTMSSKIERNGGTGRIEVVGMTTGTVLASVNTSAQWPDRWSITFATGTNTAVKVRVYNVTNSETQWYLGNVWLRLDDVQLEKASTASAYTLPLRIVGDLDLRAHVALEDWTLGVFQEIVAKWTASPFSYLLRVTETGNLLLAWSPSGSDSTNRTSTVAVPFTDGQRGWIRATLDVDNGAGGHTTRFYTSTDGVTWTQLGADVVISGTASIFPGTAPLQVSGRDATSNPLKGKVLSAEVRAGIDGTVVARYDSRRHNVNLLTPEASSFEDGTDGGWSTYTSVTMANSVARAYHGAHSLRVTVSALTTAPRARSSYVPVTPGQTYTASAYMFVPAGHSAWFGVKGYTSAAGGGENWTAPGNTASATTDAWVRLTTTFTVPTGTFSITPTPGITLNGGGNVAVGTTFDVDAVQVEVGSTATPYNATTETAIDPTGKTWSISRSGDATAEIVDRNTWAFTGTERVTLPDRDVLDIGSGVFTAYAEVATRAGSAVRALAKRDSATGTGWEVYKETGSTNLQFYASDGTTSLFGATVPALAPVSDGGFRAWGITFDLPASTVTGHLEGASSTRTGTAATVNTVAPLAIGNASAGGYAGSAALISWVALFRRALTTAEHAELAGWDGRVATEPTWLRGAAALYVNADDPTQRREYRVNNAVRNLVQVASAPALTTTTTGWSRAVLTGITPADATKLNVVARVSEANVGEVHYVDALQLEQRTYATPYAQAGTAHASTSTRQQPWVLGGDSIEVADTLLYRNTGDPYVGVAHLHINVDARRNYWPMTQIPLGAQTMVATAPSTTYTLSAYGKHGASSYLRVLDGSTGAVLAAGVPDYWGGTAYSRRVLTFTTGATTASVRVQLVALLQTVFLDAFQLEQKPYATAFESAATANASTSTRQAPWTLGGTGATVLTREAGTAAANAGGWIMRVDHAEGVGSGAGHDVTLAPQTTYTISAWAKTPAGEPPALIQVSSGGVVLATGNAQLGTADVWERISLTFTTGTGTLYTVAVVASSATNVSHNFFVDAVLIEKGPSLNDFFDGDTYAFLGDSMWEGAADLSRSHYYPQRRSKNFRMGALLPKYTPMGSSARLNYGQPL